MVSDGFEQSRSTLSEVLFYFSKASGMQINDDKYALLFIGLDDYELTSLMNAFSFPMVNFDNGMEYLGFHLKPCRYYIKDWDWLIAKVEKRIKNQIFRWLSKGGKLTLVKSVLEVIPVYWMHFWFPLGIIEKIRK